MSKCAERRFLASGYEAASLETYPTLCTLDEINSGTPTSNQPIQIIGNNTMPGFSDHNYSVRTLSDHTYAKAVPHIGTATRTDKDGTAVSDTMKNTSEAVLFFDKLFDSVNGWGSIKKKKGSGKEKIAMPVLSKHAILSGQADFCCLLCEVTFKFYEDAVAHISTQTHIANLEDSSYADKYAEERIRKTKQWYYCEPCNTVISSLRKVATHVSDELHQLIISNIDVKYTSKFKRLGNGVAYEDVLIEDDAWNGIVDMCCVVCDIDWSETHTSEFKHVMNLIQTKVNADASSNPFRKIDNSQYQCLLCNTITSKIEFFDHLETKEHLLVQSKRRKEKRAVEENNDKLGPDMSKMKKEKDNLDIVKSKLDTGTTGNSDIKIIIGTPQNVTQNENMVKPKLDTATTGNTDIKMITGTLEKVTKNDPKVASNESKQSNPDEQLTGYRCPEHEITRKYMLTSLSGMLMCTLCNWELEPKYYNSHISTEHHQNLEEFHRIYHEEIKETIKKKSERRPRQQTETYSELVCINYHGMDNIFEMMDRLQTDSEMCTESNDMLNERAYCELCKLSLNMNPNTLKKHMNEHLNVIQGKLENEIARKKITPNTQNTKIYEDGFFLGNRIEVNSKTGKAYCEFCKMDLQSQKKCLEEHANGARHKRNMAKGSEPEKVSSEKTMKESDTEAIVFELMSKFVAMWKLNLRDCIVNNLICVSVWSYSLVNVSGDEISCLVCNDTFEEEDFEYHVNGSNHKHNLAGIPVVTNVRDEFVRQINKYSFHCGFCHLVVVDWFVLREHLKSASHIKEKESAQKRLERQRDPVLVTQETLEFIRKVNDMSGRTYFT